VSLRRQEQQTPRQDFEKDDPSIVMTRGRWLATAKGSVPWRPSTAQAQAHLSADLRCSRLFLFRPASERC
jgi:hypothetical protein